MAVSARVSLSAIAPKPELVHAPAFTSAGSTPAGSGHCMRHAGGTAAIRGGLFFLVVALGLNLLLLLHDRLLPLERRQRVLGERSSGMGELLLYPCSRLTCACHSA